VPPVCSAPRSATGVGLPPITPPDDLVELVTLGLLEMGGAQELPGVDMVHFLVVGTVAADTTVLVILPIRLGADTPALSRYITMVLSSAEPQACYSTKLLQFGKLQLQDVHVRF
jgi:hypothetical protein